MDETTKDTLRSTAGRLAGFLPTNLLHQSGAISLEDTIERLRIEGDWDGLYDIWWQSDKSSLTTYLNFNAEEKAQLAQAFALNGRQDIGADGILRRDFVVLATRNLAQSAQLSELYDEMTQVLVEKGISYEALGIALPIGLDEQIGNIVCNIIHKHQGDGGQRVYSELEAGLSPERTLNVVRYAIHKLINDPGFSDDSYMAYPLAALAQNKEILMEIALPSKADSHHSFYVIQAGLDLLEKYNLSESEQIAVKQNIGNNIIQEHFRGASKDLAYRSAKVSENYEAAANEVYSLLVVGRIEPAKQLLIDLPDMELDRDKLMDVANILLGHFQGNKLKRTDSYGVPTLDIIAAVYTAGLAEQKLDSGKLIKAVNEYASRTYRDNRADQVQIGAFYLQQVHDIDLFALNVPQILECVTNASASSIKLA